MRPRRSGAPVLPEFLFLVSRCWIVHGQLTHRERLNCCIECFCVPCLVIRSGIVAMSARHIEPGVATFPHRGLAGKPRGEKDAYGGVGDHEHISDDDVIVNRQYGTERPSEARQDDQLGQNAA